MYEKKKSEKLKKRKIINFKFIDISKIIPEVLKDIEENRQDMKTLEEKK